MPTAWNVVPPPMALSIHCDTAAGGQSMHAWFDAHPEMRFLVRSISMTPYLVAFSSRSPHIVLSLAARCPHLRRFHCVVDQEASLASEDVSHLIEPFSFKELAGLDIGSSNDSTMLGPTDAFLSELFAFTPNLDGLSIRAPCKTSISKQVQFPITVSSLYLRGSDQPSPSVVRILTSSSATLRRLRVDLHTVSDGTSQDTTFRALFESDFTIRELKLVCTPRRTPYCLTSRLGMMLSPLSRLRHLTLVLRTMRECLNLEEFLNFLPCPLNSLRLDLHQARDILHAQHWRSLVAAVSRSKSLRALRKLELVTISMPDEEMPEIVALYQECRARRIVLDRKRVCNRW